MGFDGRVLDATGTPIGATSSVQISLHTALTGGTSVWTESFTVTPQDGYFHVDLGSTSALAPVLRANGSLWVETTVGGVAMTPRSALNATPYAIAGDPLSNLSCADGDSIRYNGTTSAWECRPTAMSQFTCIPPNWSYGVGDVCTTTVTLAQTSLVVATVTGHWVASSPCTGEILFDAEATNSAYTAKNGLHSYYNNWHPINLTRAEVLAPGTHTVRYAIQGGCTINGSGLHGYVLPQ